MVGPQALTVRPMGSKGRNSQMKALIFVKNSFFKNSKGANLGL
jgi:hypothetical protein